MLRKTLILGMGFILALSLLVVSMITCFTYEADAHAGGLWYCENKHTGEETTFNAHPGEPWVCTFVDHHHHTGE